MADEEKDEIIKTSISLPKSLTWKMREAAAVRQLSNVDATREAMQFWIDKGDQPCLHCGRAPSENSVPSEFGRLLQIFERLLLHNKHKSNTIASILNRDQELCERARQVAVALQSIGGIRDESGSSSERSAEGRQKDETDDRIIEALGYEAGRDESPKPARRKNRPGKA